MKIFITGISSGIGRATTQFLISRGHQVWGIARRKAHLEALAQELSSPNFSFNSCDLSVPSELSNLILELKNKNFIPDVVILNAAQLIEDDALITEPEVFNQTLAVNFHSQLFLVKAFLNTFQKKGQGHFIAVNSTAAIRSTLRSISYSTSKFALALAFKKLNHALAHQNIIFSTLYLGPTDTSMWEGKRFWLIPKPKHVAAHIEKIIQSKKRTSYYPLLSTSLFRLGMLAPDSLYTELSHWLLK